MWPGINPIGRRISFMRSRTTSGPWAFIYRPLARNYTPRIRVLVRTTADAPSPEPALRAVVRELDPDLPLVNAGPLETATNLSLLPIQVASILAVAAGLIALALAATGLYGIVSYLARQRVREIGIRLALGATPRDIVRLITRQGMRWTTIGLSLGVVAALAVAQMLRTLLYGIPPADVVAFAGVPVLLFVTAYLASWLPAWRSSHLSFLSSLRED